MLDNRLYTFLELCDVMHYRKTAQRLQMTQPAVTQHIQYLEQQYNCRLFSYANRRLTKTAQCHRLEHYVRGMVALEQSAREQLAQPERRVIRIGATKTIGEYALDSATLGRLLQPNHQVTVLVDNTKALLDKLGRGQLDLLLVEGQVDRERYHCQPISVEAIVGICGPNHPFAHREVTVEELLEEPIILREEGSGTRAVFEAFLQRQGYGLDAFRRQTVLSSNRLITMAVADHLAVSVVYDSIPKAHKEIATFTIQGGNLSHGFHYVYMDGAKARAIIGLLEGREV